jgi:hypothetical protein
MSESRRSAARLSSAWFEFPLVEEVVEVPLLVATGDRWLGLRTLPEMSPTASAPTAAAATMPASPPAVRRVRPFIALTIQRNGSGSSHQDVKPSSTLARNRLRRATPTR